MKASHILHLQRLAAPAVALLLLASGCTTAHMTGAFAGGSLGAIFGSSIGGLIGGPRGADAGRAIGLLTGTAVGTAAADAATSKRRPDTSRPAPDKACERYDDIAYDSYPSPVPPTNRWGYIEVTNVTFADADGNHVLNAGEHAYVSFEIYNRGDRTLHDVAPVIACDNRRIRISPTAIISALPPGRGTRYRAAVLADRRLRTGEVRFTVSFGTDAARVVAKRFSLHTAR